MVAQSSTLNNTF